jgi:16S rRNA (adenine1518-N6/adenine1519-N6)-dimethyltransferase
MVSMTGTPAPGDETLRQVVGDLVDHAFATLRKMARGALATYLGSDRVSEMITQAGLNPEDRGEAWTLEDFVALARVVVERRRRSRKLSPPPGFCSASSPVPYWVSLSRLLTL